MLFLEHIKKQSGIDGKSYRSGYAALVGGYLLNYLRIRPPLIRSVGPKRYRDQKKLLYTVVTGGYDIINEIPKKLANWDYICFTDHPELKSDTWQIRLLQNEQGLDPVRLSRHYKINNHLVDSGYDISVYFDANYRIRGDLDYFITHVLPPGKDLGMLLHPFHSSLYEEVELCVAAGKDDEESLRRQYLNYVEAEKFTDPYPHIAGGVIVRRSGNPEVKKLMETWFKELRRWSRRDQMAFNYSLWQCRTIIPHYIPYWMIRPYFKKMDHSHQSNR